MYIPPAFKNDDIASIRATIRDARLGTLVTATADGPIATPMPLFLDDNEGERGVLYGHLAKANPHWRLPPIGEALAIFTGPEAYVTPSWYATKQETGKVVPTWNYDVLAVHGDLVAHDDQEWLRDLVTRLTNHHEQRSTEPWQITDAPETYIRGQLNGIVGIALTITSVEGQAKMSQNQPERNVDGVVAGLRESAVPADHAVAERVAELGSTNAKGRG